MKHIVLDSERFINEWLTKVVKISDVRFCKLTDMKYCSLEKFFNGYFRRLSGMPDEFFRTFDGSGFESYYNEKFGGYKSSVSLCGASYEFISTDKGDKYVFKFDDTHRIEVYPVVDGEGKAPDYIETNPKYPYLMFVIYDGNNRTRLENIGKLFDLNDWNYGNGKYKPLMSVSEIYDMFDAYTKNWSLRNKYHSELSKYTDIISQYENHIDSEERKRRYIYTERKLNMTLAYTHNGKVIDEEHSVKKEALARVAYGTHITEEMLRKLFAFKMKGDFDDTVSADIHPDTSDMPDRSNVVVNNSKYTARELPKDIYELIDVYRNPSGETCEHCGKKHIVNIMVIENPKGEVFHVGNECVWKLVGIPEEEFDQWNQPFVDALNAVTRYNKDGKEGYDRHWFIYGDKCYYLSSEKPLDEYDFLCTEQDFKYNHFTKKSTRGALKFKEYDGVHNITGGESIDYTGVEFMKRLLPVYYKKAIVAHHNIKDIVNIVTKDRNSDWRKFSYDGEEYDISSFTDAVDGWIGYGKRTESNTYTSGALTVGVEASPADYTKLPRWYAEIDGYGLEITFTCDELENEKNPFLK